MMTIITTTTHHCYYAISMLSEFVTHITNCVANHAQLHMTLVVT